MDIFADGVSYDSTSLRIAASATKIHVKGKGVLNCGGVMLPNLKIFEADEDIVCEGFFEMLGNAPILREIRCSLPYVDGAITFPAHPKLRELHCIDKNMADTRIDISRLKLKDVCFEHNPLYISCGDHDGGQYLHAFMIEGTDITNPCCTIYIGEGDIESEFLRDTIVFGDREEFESIMLCSVEEYLDRYMQRKRSRAKSAL